MVPGVLLPCKSFEARAVTCVFCDEIRDCSPPARSAISRRFALLCGEASNDWLTKVD